ncbi:MAG TPA: flagellar motor switch protein FliM, partial [Candidatus Defluviicoccus seviourii]|nr:flagellar motor switch protein FliM [Candidatus Defluviicoccus seviourii]
MVPPSPFDPDSPDGGSTPASDDQEDLAAAWEAMTAELDSGVGADEALPAAAAASPPPTRVLSQNEIDSLLGFEEEHDGGAFGQSGIQAIINSALVSYERLPMLEVVFDRLVRLMSTSMRNFTSDNVEVSLDSIASVRFGDYLNGVPLPAMLSVIRAEQWDNYI